MIYMMDQITNAHRAAYAEHGLDAYAQFKEGRCNYDPVPDMAGDLICDLLHLVRTEGGDPLAVLCTAQMNFEAEESES